MKGEIQRPTRVLSARSDEELLLRYRDRGDVAAFEVLLHRYQRELLTYLTRYVRSASLAEDVLQATFFLVHERCRLFTAGGRVRPWLYSMATHQAIDALRKEKRNRGKSLNDRRTADGRKPVALEDLLTSREPTPPERCEQRERADWTRHAVDALPDDWRVVILLIYFQGLTFREAAEVLELPLGTVKSRVHEALGRLRATSVAGSGHVVANAHHEVL